MPSICSVFAALLAGRSGSPLRARVRLCAAACLAVLPLCAPRAASAQAALHAEESMSPWSVGAGFSNFALDWGPGRRISGVTAWVDWRVPTHLPVLNRIGAQVEGRELDFLKPGGLPYMRQETGLGGLTVELPGRRRLHPYAKYLVGIGGIYFAPSGYSHDTRKVLAPGGGLDCRLRHGLSLRADYEYQFWRNLFGGHDLNPNGVTVGVSWNLAHH